MNSDSINPPITVDRLATAEEIRAATPTYPHHMDDCIVALLAEIASDLGGYVRIPAMEIETSLMLEELLRGQNTKAN